MHALKKSNNEIITLIKVNNKRVIRELYYEHRTYFLSWVSKEHDISFEDAQDLYQDVMVILVQKIQDGKVDRIFSTFRAYIFGLGKQLIRNKIKSEFKRAKREDVYSYQMLLSDRNDLEDEQIKLVLDVLNNMPDPCRYLLQLFYIENLSYEQIAVSLQHKSVKNLKVRKYRCLNALKEVLFNAMVNK